MRLTPGLDEEVIARTAAQVELTASLQLTLDHLAIFDTQLQVSLAKVSGDLPGAIELAREADRLEGLMPYSFGAWHVSLRSTLAVNYCWKLAITRLLRQLSKNN